ncbi:peptidase [Bacillus sp. AGMB 02131]|uniref:Peptidase n=1 Tax=Peribacillus faecalis TaxID=2772559 RepID=A0A927D053_9BACI|nr:peptidase [Peribacillus faecalis]MBD3109842.1 peptidase [Peribacillus faecalis]
MNVKETIKTYIYSQRKAAVQLLQQLVQQPSVRGNEGKTQAIVVEKCRQLGLEIDLWDLDEDPKLKTHASFHCDREQFKGNPNMVAVLKGSGGGKSLILNGHIDVVPEGNEADWHVSPFSGVEENERIYGRGTTDMKGGNVALLLAMEAIIKTGILLKGDVIFQSVIEEESGGAGTLAAVLRGYKADGAIIPEPTSMKLFPYQQGSMWFRLHIKGRLAHGGTRYEGVSSLDLAYDVIQAIKQLESMRNKELKKDKLYKNVPIPIPINIGVCKTGNWPSSVPDLTVLEGRFGVSPYETIEEAQKDLEHQIAELNETHDWFRSKPVELEWYGARWLPGRLDLNHPLMRTISKNYQLEKKAEPVIEASPWGTDGGILSTVANIPVVVFGPGVTEKAHDIDEYILIDDVLAAAVIIAGSVIDWCEINAEE